MRYRDRLVVATRTRAAVVGVTPVGLRSPCVTPVTASPNHLHVIFRRLTTTDTAILIDRQRKFHLSRTKEIVVVDQTEGRTASFDCFWLLLILAQAIDSAVSPGLTMGSRRCRADRWRRVIAIQIKVEE